MLSYVSKSSVKGDKIDMKLHMDVSIQGAPYVFERFSEAVLRSWVDVEIKYYHIFLTKVYTFQIP